jgi:tight adherence protein C
MENLIPSLLYGAAIGISAWLILSVMFAKRTNRGKTHRFELERRAELRTESFAYRHFEPAIDELAEEIEKGKTFKYEEFAEYLAASGEKLPWKSAEFIGTKLIEALIACVGTFLFVKYIFLATLPTAAITAVVASAGYVWLCLSSVKKKAEKRRIVVKRAFASAVDLLALMMEVGGSFQESIRVVARENQGKSIGEELSLIVNDIEMGKPRKAALVSFAERMNDEDISEVIFACNESEDLGVPIADTLKTQADRIRSKRTSWAEKAAQEAEVTLVFPSMLIMIACLICVGAPFMLQGAAQFFGL